MYYIIKLYYFVAFAYLHAYFANVFLKINNVDKIKNVKTFFTSILMNCWRANDVNLILIEVCFHVLFSLNLSSL